MKQLLDGVYTWSVWNEAKELDFNGHYLLTDEGACIIDPPPLSDADVEEIGRLGRPIAIVVTNHNHVRDAQTLHQAFGCQLAVPALDAAQVGCPFDATYGDGDTFGPLGAIVLANQKSPGESALYWPKRRLLVLGDALIGKPAGKLSLLPPAKYADVAKAREGLKPLLELDVETLLVGDGTSFVEGGGQALKAFFAG